MCQHLEDLCNSVTNIFQMTNPHITKFKVLGFNVIKNGKFLGMFSDFILQLTIKKLLLVKFWCNIREYLQLPEKAVTILLLFQLHIYMSWISTYTSTKRTYHNSLSAEADTGI